MLPVPKLPRCQDPREIVNLNGINPFITCARKTVKQKTWLALSFSALKLCSCFRGEHLIDIVVSSLTFLYIRDVRLCTGFILYLNVIDKAYYFNFGYKHELPLQLCCTGQAISISYPCSVAWLPAFADTLAPGHPGFSAAPCLPVFRLRAMQVLKRKFE